MIIIIAIIVIFYGFIASVHPCSLEACSCILGPSCIFAVFCSPAPVVKWSRVDGQLPNGRHRVSDYGTQLTIQNVSSSDAGEYECRGHNSRGAGYRRVRLIVGGERITRILYVFLFQGRSPRRQLWCNLGPSFFLPPPSAPSLQWGFEDITHGKGLELKLPVGEFSSIWDINVNTVIWLFNRFNAHISIEKKRKFCPFPLTSLFSSPPRICMMLFSLLGVPLDAPGLCLHLWNHQA